MSLLLALSRGPKAASHGSQSGDFRNDEGDCPNRCRKARAKAKELDGMIALNEHKVSDLLDSGDFAKRWISMVETTPIGIAVKELQKPRIQIIVGVDGQTGKATGAIIRAHRRY